MLKVGDKPVANGTDLVDAVSQQAIGSKVTVEYWREGKTQSTPVTIRELASKETQAQVAASYGISLR